MGFAVGGGRLDPHKSTISGPRPETGDKDKFWSSRYTLGNPAENTEAFLIGFVRGRVDDFLVLFRNILPVAHGEHQLSSGHMRILHF